MRIQNYLHGNHNARTRRVLLVLSIVALAACAIPFFISRAANPSTGTIAPAGPVTPFTGSWDGTATGTGSVNGESTCLEGTNCDTFTLTVSGQATDYAGKVIAVKIEWGNEANDYDLYIHKGPNPNTDPVVAQSANGAPQTSEMAVIDPTFYRHRRLYGACRLLRRCYTEYRPVSRHSQRASHPDWPHRQLH